MSFLVVLFFPFILFSLFYFLSFSISWDQTSASSFECGFGSYFFSHFPFSIHFFSVALIFLFLDLELCVLFYFFLDFQSNYFSMLNLSVFILFLLLGLILEISEGSLDWRY